MIKKIQVKMNTKWLGNNQGTFTPSESKWFTVKGFSLEDLPEGNQVGWSVIDDIRFIDDEQQTPDEKVLDYLERAEKIAIKWDISDKEYLTTDGLVEIAKLLQRETNK